MKYLILSFKSFFVMFVMLSCKSNAGKDKVLAPTVLNQKSGDIFVELQIPFSERSVSTTIVTTVIRTVRFSNPNTGLDITGKIRVQGGTDDKPISVAVTQNLITAGVPSDIWTNPPMQPAVEASCGELRQTCYRLCMGQARNGEMRMNCLADLIEAKLWDSTLGWFRPCYQANGCQHVGR